MGGCGDFCTLWRVLEVIEEDGGNNKIIRIIIKGLRAQKSLEVGGGETERRPSSAPSGTLSLPDEKELSRTMGLWERVGGVIGVLEEHGEAEKMGK